MEEGVAPAENLADEGVFASLFALALTLPALGAFSGRRGFPSFVACAKPAPARCIPRALRAPSLLQAPYFPGVKKCGVSPLPPSCEWKA